MCEMVPLLSILLCSGSFGSFVLGLNTKFYSPDSATLSFAFGMYGCSFKFFKHYCWRYCTGNSGDWCYTVPTQTTHCTKDRHCYFESRTCDGWCAWNSDSGCSKSCHLAEITPKPEKAYCRPGRPYWDCQSEYGDLWRSRLALEATWISPDIPNERVLNKTGNTIEFNGNILTSTKESTRSPQSALWYPIGEIQKTSSIFYWTFLIREIGTSSESSIFIGISDLTKLASGWSTSGLFYDGHLSVGSGQLAENFGPRFQVGDRVSILVKTVDGKIKVYIILNNRPLGLAFDVPENTLNGIFPVVKFLGKGSLEITERDIEDAPSELELVKKNPLEGNWTLQILEDKKIFPTKVTMKISEFMDSGPDRAYEIHIYAFNMYYGNINEKSISNWTGYIIHKTNWQGNAEEMKVDSKITEQIIRLKRLVLDTANNELRLETEDFTSLWQKIKPKISVVDWNPFKTSN